MNEAEFLIWLLFMLGFAILPIKPLLRAIWERVQGKITPCIDEEGYGEKHNSQLYRPGDKKYNRIVELSNNAKAIHNKK
ncbi:MAG TPA: hypothetical protein EYP59_22840 [Thiotrichaceae bacterium]|nr:hypothetical protein [Thiotrichaceae bacterium]